MDFILYIENIFVIHRREFILYIQYIQRRVPAGPDLAQWQVMKITLDIVACEYGVVVVESSALSG